jgi:hypothetical protein
VKRSVGRAAKARQGRLHTMANIEGWNELETTGGVTETGTIRALPLSGVPHQRDRGCEWWGDALQAFTSHPDGEQCRRLGWFKQGRMGGVQEQPSQQKAQVHIRATGGAARCERMQRRIGPG